MIYPTKIISFVLFFHYKATTPSYFSLAAALQQPLTTIKICQNKNCVKQFPQNTLGTDSLPALYQNLLLPSSNVQIETSGCLSQCGKGPNVEISSWGGLKVIQYNRVDDVDTVTSSLYAGGLDLVPKLLIWAHKLMAKAAATSGDLDFQESYLTGVINVLEGQEGEFSECHALASALMFRCRVRMEKSKASKRSSASALVGEMNDAVGDDLEKALRIDPERGDGWKLLAEVKELQGDIEGALEATRRWGAVEPLFGTKAAKEVQRLLSLL